MIWHQEHNLFFTIPNYALLCHCIGLGRASKAVSYADRWNTYGTVQSPKNVQAVCKRPRALDFRRPISATGEIGFLGLSTRAAVISTNRRIWRFISSIADAVTNGAWEPRIG